MKTLLIVLITAALPSYSLTALAATSVKSKKHVVKEAAVQASATPAKKSRLGTNFDFQGLSIGGKYNSADGILTTVESDKSLGNLLSPRPNFKDRIAVAEESQ